MNFGQVLYWQTLLAIAKGNFLDFDRASFDDAVLKDLFRLGDKSFCERIEAEIEFMEVKEHGYIV